MVMVVPVCAAQGRVGWRTPFLNVIVSPTDSPRDLVAMVNSETASESKCRASPRNPYDLPPSR